MTHSRLRQLSLFLAVAHGYKFSLTASPTQCGNLTATWDGGKAPYELLLVPVGHVSPEIRTIVDQKVTGGSSASVAPLKFPKGSQFVAVLSDADGVGAGGTSDILTVGDGPSDCLTGPVQAKWVLYMDNPTPGQCASTGVSWDSSAQGPVSLWGIVPAGQSFDLNPPSSGTSFDWTPGVKEGTKLMIVAGDSNGRGTGGSSDLFSVTGDGGGSCINNNSPGPTGNPVAGQVAAASPTSDSSNAANSDSPSSTNVSNNPSGTSVSGTGNHNSDTDSNSGDNSNDASDPSSSSSTGGDASQQADPSNSSSKHHVPIVAIVLPILVVVLLLLLGLFFCLRSRRRSTRASAQSSFDNMRGRGDLLASHPPSIAGSAGVDSVLTRAPHENVPRIYETEPFVMRPRGGGGADLQRTHSGGGYSADVSDAASTRESMRGLLAVSPLATPTDEKAAYLSGGFLHPASQNPFASPLDATAPSPAPSHSPPSFHTVATRGHSPRPDLGRRMSDRAPIQRTGTLYAVSPSGVGMSTSTLGTLNEGDIPPTYDSWTKHAGFDAGHLAGQQGYNFNASGSEKGPASSSGH
ncbi:hypothetical protein EXIGLDRAFT_719291 [Exidia glandulosa HHB12029]|uniref:Mid2 domain-containing protein n=1 Tax=Exidia glandulosa HHB12029 TaxID=1314781 RepID=A0A165H5V2_EXIGL|nr:hypothetical protein EXIGLDRAFT_719291 [Exidia glandulosa HHB12029]